VIVPLSREQVIKALGDVDDAIITEVVGMGATAEELAEAQAWIANDEALINSGKPLVVGRISRLADILSSLEERDEPDLR
jgi:hypothetical protein